MNGLFAPLLSLSLVVLTLSTGAPPQAKAQTLSMGIHSTHLGVQTSATLLRPSLPALQGLRLLLSSPGFAIVAIAGGVYLVLDHWSLTETGENLALALSLLDGRLLIEDQIDRELLRHMKPEHFVGTHWGANLPERIYYKSKSLELLTYGASSVSTTNSDLKDLVFTPDLFAALEQMDPLGQLTLEEVLEAYGKAQEFYGYQTFSLQDLIDLLLGRPPREQRQGVEAEDGVKDPLPTRPPTAGETGTAPPPPPTTTAPPVTDTVVPVDPPTEGHTPHNDTGGDPH